MANMMELAIVVIRKLLDELKEELKRVIDEAITGGAQVRDGDDLEKDMPHMETHSHQVQQIEAQEALAQQIMDLMKGMAQDVIHVMDHRQRDIVLTLERLLLSMMLKPLMMQSLLCLRNLK
jgi:hypothetical protein